MTYEVAMSKMREGGVCRRAAWGDEQAIIFVQDKDESYHEFVGPTWIGAPKRSGMRVALLREDLIAEDWDICGGYCS